MSRTEALFMSCAPGLEPVLLAEVKALALTTARAVPGGVEATGPVGSYELCNLWLRTASRVSVDGADSSGELLYFRGYRQEIGRAPLRETLAAGILGLAGYTGAAPLWDVMCGSGTFLIEAALLALGRAPGAQRHFAFEQWPSHDARRWAARPRERTGVVAPVIIGSDLNAGALGIARRNARRAAVFEHLTLERLDATAFAPAVGLAPGLMVANLPYGIRVGDEAELPSLVKRLHANLQRHFAGWRYAFLLPAGVEGAPAQRLPLQNGGIRCELWLGQVG